MGHVPTFSSLASIFILEARLLEDAGPLLSRLLDRVLTLLSRSLARSLARSCSLSSDAFWLSVAWFLLVHFSICAFLVASSLSDGSTRHLHVHLLSLSSLCRCVVFMRTTTQFFPYLDGVDPGSGSGA